MQGGNYQQPGNWQSQSIASQLVALDRYLRADRGGWQGNSRNSRAMALREVTRLRATERNLRHNRQGMLSQRDQRLMQQRINTLRQRYGINSY